MFSTLLSCGVPILQSIEETAKEFKPSIANALTLSRTAIKEGDTIADPLEATGLFEPFIIKLIAIGEATGQLDTMLMKAHELQLDLDGYKRK